MERRARPAIAAVLALAVAGLGHAYLRRWGRAAAWFLTIVTTAVVLVSAFADSSTGVREWPLTVVLPLLGLFVLSAVDAYLLAAREPTGEEGPGDEDASTCPECGREVDPGLDFCHWCTRRLSADAEGAEEGRGQARDDADGRL